MGSLLGQAGRQTGRQGGHGVCDGEIGWERARGKLWMGGMRVASFSPCRDVVLCTQCLRWSLTRRMQTCTQVARRIQSLRAFRRPFRVWSRIFRVWLRMLQSVGVRLVRVNRLGPNSCFATSEPFRTIKLGWARAIWTDKSI